MTLCIPDEKPPPIYAMLDLMYILDSNPTTPTITTRSSGIFSTLSPLKMVDSILLSENIFWYLSIVNFLVS